MMKVKLLLLSLLLLCAFISIIVPYAEASDSQELWALIICGSANGSFSNNTQYMYHVLNDTYDFNGIYYLDVYSDRPGVDASSTRANVRSAITGWLNNHSDENDIIFIYFTSHGSGYLRNYGFGPFIFHVTYYAMGDHGRISFETNDEDQAREVSESRFRLSGCPRILVYYDLDDDGQTDDFYWDYDNDERIEMIVDINGTLYDGGELLYIDVDGDGNNDDLFADIGSNNRTDILIGVGTWTSDGEDGDNDGIIIGVDFNGDGAFNEWVGIDEGLKVQNETYWDDELASDLNTLSYAKLIFVRQGCVEGNQSCFGGGLIDDLSAPNRIIMCATNETWYSYGDLDTSGNPGYGYSEWSEAFIDALHGERTYWNATTSEVVHTGINVDADLNDNGHVSMWEAWHYAWNNDEARLSGYETPWFDDDGDGLPTFRNGADNLDNNQGSVANMTYIDWLLGDIDENGTVELADFFFVSQAFGSYPGHDRWDPRCDLNCDGFVELMDFYHMSQNFGKTWSGGSSSGSGKGSSGNGSPLLGYGTTFSVIPNQITVLKDESFSVNISLNDVTDLYGWELKLFWDNSILNCTDSMVYAPKIWANSTYQAGPGVQNDYNATHGRFFKLLIAIYPASSFNGTTVTAPLTFKAVATGTTTLHLQDTKLISSQGEAISHTANDASITVLLMRITLRPNAAGTYTQFPYQHPASGSHWDKVDDETPDGDATIIFVSDSIAWYADSFNIADISIPENATIKSVTIYSRVASLAGGRYSGYYQTLICTHNTNYYGTLNRPPATYTTYHTPYTTNPYTGQAWTAQEINALQIGAYARATYLNGQYWDLYCTQIYLTIEII